MVKTSCKSCNKPMTLLSFQRPNSIEKRLKFWFLYGGDVAFCILGELICSSCHSMYIKALGKEITSLVRRKND